MSVIKIGTAEAKPGEKATGWLQLSYYADGSPIEAPIIILNGAQPGPKLWVQACQHAREYNGLLAILDAIKQLDPKKMRGSLIACPAMQIAGFRMGQRNAPDNTNNNRIWPGNPIGRITEQMAHVYWQEVIKYAEYFIDFHTSAHERTKWLFYYKDEAFDEPQQKSKELGKIFGFPIIVGTKISTFDNAISTQLSKYGIPSIVPEVSHLSFAKQNELQRTTLEHATRGMLNVMKHLHIIDGKPELPDEPPIICNEWIWSAGSHTNKHGGIIDYKIEATQRVKKGQLVATISDVFGNETEQLYCPADGVVICHGSSPVILPGSNFLQIGTDIEE